MSWCFKSQQDITCLATAMATSRTTGLVMKPLGIMAHGYEIKYLRGSSQPAAVCPVAPTLRQRAQCLTWTKDVQTRLHPRYLHQADAAEKNSGICSKLNIHSVLLVVLDVRGVRAGRLDHTKLGQLGRLLLHALLPPFDPAVLEPDFHLAGKQHQQLSTRSPGAPFPPTPCSLCCSHPP